VQGTDREISLALRITRFLTSVRNDTRNLLPFTFSLWPIARAIRVASTTCPSGRRTLSDGVVIPSGAKYLKPQPLIEMDDNRTVTLFLPAVERGFVTRNRKNKGFYTKMLNLYRFTQMKTNSFSS